MFTVSKTVSRRPTRLKTVESFSMVMMIIITHCDSISQLLILSLPLQESVSRRPPSDLKTPWLRIFFKGQELFKKIIKFL